MDDDIALGTDNGKLNGVLLGIIDGDLLGTDDGFCSIDRYSGG